MCKTENRVRPHLASWLSQAIKNGLCTKEAAEILSSEQPQQYRIRESELVLPKKWAEWDPQCAKRLSQQFFEAIPGGYSAKLHGNIIKSLDVLTRVIQAWEESGHWVGSERPDEKRDLQAALLEFVRSHGLPTREGAEINGGETDVILCEDVLVENKVAAKTDEPFASKIDAPWQARRYAIAMNQRAWFIVTAYQPSTERGILPMPDRIRVDSLTDGRSQCAVIRIVIPYGYSIPSKAKAPTSEKT